MVHYEQDNEAIFDDQQVCAGPELTYNRLIAVLDDRARRGAYAGAAPASTSWHTDLWVAEAAAGGDYPDKDAASIAAHRMDTYRRSTEEALGAVAFTADSIQVAIAAVAAHESSNGRSVVVRGMLSVAGCPLCPH